MYLSAEPLALVFGTLAIALGVWSAVACVRNTLNVQAIPKEVQAFTHEERALIEAHVLRSRQLRLRFRSIGVVVALLGGIALPAFLLNELDVIDAVLFWAVIGYAIGGILSELAAIRLEKGTTTSAILHPREPRSYRSSAPIAVAVTFVVTTILVSAIVAVETERYTPLVVRSILVMLLIAGTKFASDRIVARSQQITGELSNEADAFLRRVSVQCVELLSVAGTSMLLSSAVLSASRLIREMRPSFVILSWVLLLSSLTCLFRAGDSYRWIAKVTK